MPTRRLSRNRSSSFRRGKLWQTASIDATTLTADATTSSNLLPNIDNVQIARTTVIRMVGQFCVRGITSNVNLGATIGIYVTTEEALTAGATLEPQTDLGPYLWYDSIYLHSSGTGFNEWVSHPINGKAKRKIQSSENRLVVTVESVGSDAGSLEVIFDIRILLAI